ncbi:hypothetical protein VZC37_12105 [Gordonia sp. LSe1-13]|uniref:Uncharacterized protein n=1 Tax=Gordonia sesuvii TaxID=3116777 RepID=A0ABU7MDA9_9ACTN|nr:hypothetical protein [Gordonia sp. LSe1-13]
MSRPAPTEERNSERLRPHRSPLRWWPVATGLSLGVFSIVTDDPNTIDGILPVLVIATTCYALIAFTGRTSWSWPITGLFAVVYLAADAASAPAVVILVGVTVVAVGVGVASGRWRPPPPEMGWQPWGASVFHAAAIGALFLDVTVAKVVIAVGLLLHGAWDIAHWRRQAVVSRSLAEWCAALDISLGIGVLALVAFT